jgi:glycosyltransferase involved in cell wall biosynthesis
MHLEDGRDVLVADDAPAFAARIVELHEDARLWNQLSRAGLDNVARHFSTDSARETVRALFLRDADTR